MPPTQADKRVVPNGVTNSDLVASLFPLPLTPLEKFLLQCETPRSSMVIRVVMRLSGQCQPDLYVETLRRALSRHPLLNCRLQEVGREMFWVPGTPEPIPVVQTAGSIFLPEIGSQEISIDLKTSVGLRTAIAIMDDGVKVVLDAHHALTDGNGLRQIITDWFHLYHCAVTGTPEKLPEMNHERLLHRHLFPQPPAIAPISLKDAIRNFLVTVRGRTSRWALPKFKKRTSEEETRSHCVEELLTIEQCEQLHFRLDAWKVKLNDLVMVSCMSTFARLAPSGSMGHRITVMNPTDLRLPSDRTLSATNRFGIAVLRRRRSECLKPEKILRGIHDEMNYVRSNYVGVEFIKGLASASKFRGGIALFRRLGWLMPSFQWTCLGDIARGVKRLVPMKDGLPITGSLRLETATGFSPFADEVPISVATCEANRRITLTVRSSPFFLTLDETQKFAAALVQQMCTMPLPSKQAGSVSSGDD